MRRAELPAAFILALLALQAWAAPARESIEALRGTGGQRGDSVELRGYYRPGDGGEGRFVWDAASSAADNGGTVIRPAAAQGSGRWLRVVADRTVEVRWFGARGDGSTDDLAAIQAAADELRARGGGRLHASAGTYLVRPRSVPGPRVINLSGARDLVVEGAGSSTTFKLDPSFPWATSQPDAHVFLCVACQRVTFRGFRIDGSGDAILAQKPRANTQMHGIFLSARPLLQQRGGPSSDITVEEIHFHNLRGDGVYGLGDENGPVYLERVTVQRNLFERNGRAGTAWQRRTRFVTVRRNVFAGIRNQAIDTEATGKSGAGEDYVFEENVFEHVSRDLCFSVSGLSARDRVSRVKVSRNVLLNCGMQIYRAQDVEVTRNVIVGSPLRRALHLFRSLDGVTVSGNVIVNRDRDARPAVYVDAQQEDTGAVRIAGNFVDATAARGDGIVVEKAVGPIEVSGNALVGGNSAATAIRVIGHKGGDDSTLVEANAAAAFATLSMTGGRGAAREERNVRSAKVRRKDIHAETVRRLDAQRPAGEKARE